MDNENNRLFLKLQVNRRFTNHVFFNHQLKTFTDIKISYPFFKGIIHPKKALKILGTGDNQIEVEVTEEAIVLKPVRKKIRKGREQAFRKMHHAGDDKPIMNAFFNDETLKDWKW